LNSQGAGYGSCSCKFPSSPTNSTADNPKGGRQKTDCCKVRAPPPKDLQCRKSLCDFDPGLCSLGDDDAFDFGDLKRSIIWDEEDDEFEDERLDDDEYLNGTSALHMFEKRARKRPFRFGLLGSADLIIFSRAYPSRGQLFATARGLRDVIHRWWR